MRNLAQEKLRDLIKEAFEQIDDVTIQKRILNQIDDAFSNFKYIKYTNRLHGILFDFDYKKIIVPCELNFFSEDVEKMGAIPFNIEIDVKKIDENAEDMFKIVLPSKEFFIVDAFDNYRNSIKGEMIDFLKTVLE